MRKSTWMVAAGVRMGMIRRARNGQWAFTPPDEAVKNTAGVMQ